MLQDYLAMLRRVNAVLDTSLTKHRCQSITERLPRDVLAYIVGFVSDSEKMRIRNTSKVIRSLVEQLSAIRRFDLTTLLARSDLPKISMFYSTATSSEVREIKLKFWFNHLLTGMYQGASSVSLRTCVIDHEGFRTTLNSATFVTELDLSMTTLDMAFMRSLHMPQLRTLALDHCSLTFTDKVDTVGAFPNLDTLSLQFCVTLTNNNLRMILDEYPRLRTLNLSGCPVGDSGFLDPTSSRPYALESLSLSQTFFSDATLIDFARRLPALSFINLSRCERLTANGLQIVLSHLSLLSELSASHLKLGFELFISLPAFNFTHLDLSSTEIGDAVCEVLLSQKTLLSLNLANCARLRKDTLRNRKLLMLLRADQQRLSPETIRYFLLRGK